MVERKSGKLAHRPPLGIGGVGTSLQRRPTRSDEREIGDADHAAAWIAAGFPERVKLLQIDVGDTRFFFEFAQGSLVKTLVFENKAAGNGELAFKRRYTTLDEKNLQFSGLDREDDDVDRNAHALQS